MSRLILGPFNRVEGDLEVRLTLADGKVAAAEVSASLYRGFEQILRGRPTQDALVVAPRICGICSVAQSLAAARAVAAAAGLVPPPLGRVAADLVLACENAADHLTHFYLFFMPDFARAAYAGRSWHEQAVARHRAMVGEAGRAAAAARVRLLHMLGVVAGKWPHSLVLQPGGVTKSVDQGERMRLVAILADFRGFLEQRLFGDRLERIAALDGPAALAAWAAERPPSTGDLRFFLHVAEDLGLAEWGRGPPRFLSHGSFGPPGASLFAPGRWRDGALLPLDLAELQEDVSHAWLDGSPAHPSQGMTEPDADKADGYSWCKAPRLAGESYEVGALARQLIAGHPLVRGLVGAAGGRANLRDRVLARLLELALLVPAMEGWVQALGGAGPFCVSGEQPKNAAGVGLVEAARGSLGHWLTVEGGRIARYQIVAPTTWNFSPRDAQLRPGPLEEALVGVPVAEGDDEALLVQHIVRSFDPCMSCTVH